MNLSEIMALTGGSAGIIVLFAVAVAPWLAAHAQTGAPRPARATPFVPSPRRPLPDSAHTAAV